MRRIDAWRRRHDHRQPRAGQGGEEQGCAPFRESNLTCSSRGNQSRSRSDRHCGGCGGIDPHGYVVQLRADAHRSGSRQCAAIRGQSDVFEQIRTLTLEAKKPAGCAGETRGSARRRRFRTGDGKTPAESRRLSRESDAAANGRGREAGKVPPRGVGRAGANKVRALAAGSGTV